MVKSALGRGFEGLIPTTLNVGDVAAPGEYIKIVSIGDIVANPEQPRKEFDQVALQELAQSIKQHGIIQPLVVTPQQNSYRIVAGERRYRAAQLAGLDKLPVIVRNHKELEELEIALVENVQRVDLSPLEQAVSIVRLRDQFSLSVKDIAAKLGKAETTISNMVRLLQLPKEVITALQANDITEGHARAILSLKGHEKIQLELLHKIVEQKLSVRESEKLAAEQKNVTIKNKLPYSSHISSILNSYSKPLVNKITIKEKSKQRGTISIPYTSYEDLKKLLASLDDSK